ncbi:MAG: aminomethyl-transferring glycine dehydrogenase [Prevotellaceae bacterium]|jgi:glycine dehydrogenase|nr:aminomethyl-transferring glycine dehydrogenase [Prevotellaceae bacterium]
MNLNQFSKRHIGINENDLPKMLETIGVKSVDELISQVVPQGICLDKPLNLPEAMTEHEFLLHIKQLAAKNEIFDNYIGLGYYGTITPAVILRNIYENPVWYTSYTPYQAEISQGRLEALLNFQTMICDLTALPLSNCSLLDEATAAAEAMTMMCGLRSKEQIKENINTIFVDKNIFPQTLAVLNTRANPQKINILVGDWKTFDFSTKVFGAIVQYPNSDGKIEDYSDFAKKCAENGAKIAVAADIMSLVLLTPPGEWGADIVFGSTQRFGIPMNYGGPSAAYMATKDEFKRNLPGRIIGISKDANGKTAYRLALQTREQHIKREKATSNICTAQALLATMAGFYAAYHGNEGLKDIAKEIHVRAILTSRLLQTVGYKELNEKYFDTLKLELPEDVNIDELRQELEKEKINIRYFDNNIVGISFDETTTTTNFLKLISIFVNITEKEIDKSMEMKDYVIPENLRRKSNPLNHEIFEKYHSETQMMRYMKSLERKDISLAHSMISLGSCTMKLNAAAEMLPLSWSEFTAIHPFAPRWQVGGYNELIENLSAYLAEISGFEAVSLMPNSGAAGEYAGLITIRNYQKSINQGHRNIVLIPQSAHGTNPASAVQAGFDVVVVACDDKGNVDLQDLRDKSAQHSENLAALMITYPSTHGVFEPEIVEICNIIHQNGAQVYMDGANMNAQVGITSPGRIGADVCHLNLHKTFASPHGGGGPGVGPIGAAKHLVEFLPTHEFNFRFQISDSKLGESQSEILNLKSEMPEYTAVAASPFGSAGILPITYGYIRMMGADGLLEATKCAIINANYLCKKLENAYGIVYTGATGRVGHEMILDCRQFKKAGITESDIAKRLMDFGFHAPTLSFPVHGTLMVEPTESEPLEELDRFVEALMTIREEISEIENGKFTAEDNVLINAPHPDYAIVDDEWKHQYSRTKAAFPLDWVKENKFWLTVARVDNAWGDRNLFCACMQ